ncbi:MAG: response regulator transcription factor [Planctomycetes bacterium]|nr:response regulator transcription factor [Planctomycetota bacterium]
MARSDAVRAPGRSGSGHTGGAPPGRTVARAGRESQPEPRGPAHAANGRVLVADDHSLVRAGIGALLRELKSVSEVLEASDGRDAVAQCVSSRPGVALLEACLSGINGVDATTSIARQAPGTRVIVFTRQSGDELNLRAFEAGAAGVLLRDSTVADFHVAFSTVMNGGTHFGPSVSKLAIEKRNGKPHNGVTHPLTDRQREILQLVAEGMSSKEIGRLLRVSVKTVETHRAHIMDRLGIRDLAGLVRYAIRTGLIVA